MGKGPRKGAHAKPLTDDGFDQDVSRFTERMVQDATVDPPVRTLLDELLAEDGTGRYRNPAQLVLRVRAVAVDAPCRRKKAVDL